MKKISVKPLEKLSIPGISYHIPTTLDVYTEDHWKWVGSALPMKTKSPIVSGGVLHVIHSEPQFSKLEYHDDCEKYVFVRGDVVMPFANLYNGVLDESSLCFALIKEGTEIIIEEKVAHFMPVAASTEGAIAVVISPEMPFHHVYLSQMTTGILDI